jgi:cell division protein FtsB
MTSHGDARDALRKSVEENRPQVRMADETLRLLRDGDRMNEQVRSGTNDKEESVKNQWIINTLVGIVMTFLAWWSNNIWNTVQNLQAQLTALNVELARNYVPRIELQQQFNQINQQLTTIERNTKR